jgi:hypothetical protein
MKGIHVNWTKPFFDRDRLRGHGFRATRDLKGECYDQPNYQILYTILSAGLWKLHNGSIKLYTDSIGFNFYQQFGINDLYDEVNISFLDGYSKSNIDPARFWTSGKIKVLANQKEPFVFMDQDMIIRQPIPEYILKGDVTATHWEIPRGYYYFEEQDWEREIKHIDFPTNYNCSDLCPNTSFLAVNNMDLNREYTRWHKKLVETNGNDVPEWFWLLTDQGILGHVIREGDYKANTLTDKVFLANSNYASKEERYKGKSEQWYMPIGADNKKDKDLVWEHVWFNKIHFNMYPEFLKRETKRYFRECIELGLGKYLQHSRFKKDWDEYNDTDN